MAVLIVLCLAALQGPAADQALIRDAEAALGFSPVSVMDKAITPPSGDKHDYMSQAPYWWPDPSKPDGLPYVQRDGDRNPEITRISDRDNLGRLIGAVSTLARAYSVTRAERYAAHAARLVRVWFLDEATRMKPHLQFGQGIPGITDGRGIGIIETRDLPRLVAAVGLLSGSPAWTRADAAGLQSWMRAYLTWLIESPHGRAESKNGNNHETWYDVQVAALALYTAQPDLARRTIEGAKSRIARQIEPDGRQPRELARTRSWDYSIFNLTAFFELASMGDRVDVDLWNYRTADGRSLRGALEFLLPYANAERKWAGRQITPFRESALHPLQTRAAAVWKDVSYLPQTIVSDAAQLRAAIAAARPGDVMEIISIKPNRNVIPGNTFRKTRGGVTNRSGNFNVIEGNVILGDREPGSYGIRITGQHHRVVGNYVADVAGSCLLLVAGEYIEKALTPEYQPILREGTPLGRVPRYAQVKHGVFEKNTFVNCGEEPVVIGSSLKAGWPQAQRILMPEENRVESNTILPAPPPDPPKPLGPADVGPSWRRP